MPYCTFSGGNEQGIAISKGDIYGNSCIPIGLVSEQSWILYDKNDYNCATGEPLFGQIMIDIPSSNFRFNDHLGNTKTWFSEEDKRILKVKIEILEGWSDSSRILEHELGHALGWNDVNITGHIMNGVWSRSGNNVKGLQK